MRTDNRTTKQKLIDLVSALQEKNIIDYCYTFIGLKMYGAAKLPDSITEELRQIYENRSLERHEMTAEEKQAREYRCNILRTIYDIESLAILYYIHIIVEDAAKEDRGTGCSTNYKDLIIKMVLEMQNELYLVRTYHYLRAKCRREKGGADDE